MNRKDIQLLATLIFAAAMLVETGEPSSAITVQTVPVGNVGNAADNGPYGSVNYAYFVGEYDVTSSQYAAFLNAVAQSDPYGVYIPAMSGTSDGNPGIIQSGSSGGYTYSVAPGRANDPVTDVTFWDTTRFANWLDNGQPTGPEGPGTTETGTYTLTSAGIANDTVIRNVNATWAVASLNEWYKAAYYSPTLNSGAGGYWPYPTQSNTISTLQANFGNSVGDTTPVGSYPYPSYYRTYDQAGDTFQWTDSTLSGGVYRAVKGGSFEDPGIYNASGDLGFVTPTTETSAIGFRVSEVPEPGSLGILALGAGILMRRRQMQLASLRRPSPYYLLEVGNGALFQNNVCILRSYRNRGGM